MKYFLLLLSTAVWLTGCGQDVDNIDSSKTDTSKPKLVEVSPVPATTDDATPHYTFKSTEVGTLSYLGDCTSPSTRSMVGINTIRFSALPVGNYNNCQIIVTDDAGNISEPLNVSAFTVREYDRTSPVLTEVTAVPVLGNDTTPDYTFDTDEAGTIIYGGSCSSTVNTATVGSNTITLNTLATGSYSNCTIRVRDASNNVSGPLLLSAFVIDVKGPVLRHVTPVPALSNNMQPSYTFSSSESGIISYSGDCVPDVFTAVAGNNTVVFEALADGVYKTCSLFVTDNAGNISRPLLVPAFTIDTVVPVLAELTPVPALDNDTTPKYSFSSTERGTISYGGSCTSTKVTAAAGKNTVAFDALASASYSNCTVQVTDLAGNTSTALAVTPFTIDTVLPVLTQVAAVMPNPTGNPTPSYTFNTTEAGLVTYAGGCSSPTANAVAGNNTVIFKALKSGLYNKCTIKVTDIAGNRSAALAVADFSVDTIVPVLKQITPVATFTNDTTPDYTFSTTEAGSIIYGGSCSSGNTVAVAGNNTVTFNTLADGTYTDCTVAVSDDLGNTSNPVTVKAFTVDTASPLAAEVIAVPDPIRTSTPRYTFSSNEIGTISYGGSCTSAKINAVAGDNALMFSALADGYYDDCTVMVTDRAGNPGNALAVTPFTVDTLLPVVTEVTPVMPDPTGNPTPDYTFNTTEAGPITYGGGCSSATGMAVAGSNTVTFNTLKSALYEKCTIKVTDAAGNRSEALLVSAFTVDTVVPVLKQITAVASFTNDTTPDYTFNSTEAGTISYGGSCASTNVSAVAGANTITFDTPLADGLYNNCTVQVTDILGNVSAVLKVSAFTIDTVQPALLEVIAVATPGRDDTPRYTFNSSEKGKITYGGACSSLNVNALAGNTAINFMALASGNYTDCTVTVTDPAGNVSSPLAVSAFEIDVLQPVLSGGLVDKTPANTSTPDFTFDSNEEGTIVYAGGCSSTSIAAQVGSNTVTFKALKTGTYSGCSIKVRDVAGNLSAALAVPSFVIDISAPSLKQVSAVPAFSNIDTPAYTFSSTEAGSISYGGSCSSTDLVAAVGNNSITFNSLADGVYSDCTITVTDAQGNVSAPLAVKTFTVDHSLAGLAEVKPVAPLTADATPAYTFSSTKAGSIIYGGSCTSAKEGAAAGNNAISFNTLADGTYNDCTVRVLDKAGNLSAELVVSAFTVDTMEPLVSEVLAVTPNPTADATPDYTFNTTEAGTIVYAGGCSSTTTTAVAGDNLISFKALPSKSYSACTIKVRDAIGNVSAALVVSPFTVDITAPALKQVTPVASYIASATPVYTFSSSEAGNIIYGGSCSSGTTVAAAGNNVISFNALADGLYADCTITVQDNLGNASAPLTVRKFTVDTALPVLAEVTPVSSPNKDTTPRYVFSSSETGTVSYGGSCSSAKANVAAGNNALNFNTLADGSYSDCTVTVTDRAGNISPALAVSAFTIDTVPPVVAEVTAIGNSTTSGPGYTFNTTEAGSIVYGGACHSLVVTANSGDNTVTLSNLKDGIYSTCNIRVKDAANNISNTVYLTPFTVDTKAPVLTQKIKVPTPSANTTPAYTFSSTEAGTISYAGGCTSATVAAIRGNNTITLDAMAFGTYSGCTITVTDALGNASAALAISSFTIVDITAPVLTEVAAVVVSGTDTTPAYTFNSTKAGTISYGGDCSSVTTAALQGDNAIDFTVAPQAEGTHSNCTITVTDASANVSLPLNVSAFTIVKPKPLNDTGITLCGDYAFDNSTNDNNDRTCGALTDVDGDPVPAGQDAENGRDANGLTNDSTDGHKGFSFTKLDSSGNALPVSALSWSCVRDNVTGLVWEEKADDGGLRDKDWTYTWYNTAGTNDGGDHGVGDTGNGATTGYETIAGTYAGSDNCSDSSRCDMQKFVADVNAASLCGASDWRLPAAEELLSIISHDRTGPAVDTAYMANTIAAGYWSATPFTAGAGFARAISFDDSAMINLSKDSSAHIRLVREAD